jgi:hypothetical protein
MKRVPKRWLLIFAVWLAIFAVAPFRYLTQSQLQNSIWPLTLLAGSRNEPGSYAQLAQQHPDNARVWAMAAEEYPFTEETYYDDDTEEVVKQQVPAAKIFPGQPEKEQNAEKRRRLDQVIEKFPNEAWLIAKRLKLSWGYMFGDRVGGELSDANLAANQAAGIPSPERQTANYNSLSPGPPDRAPKLENQYPKYPNYKPQELQRVLELCKRGQKLEPNNAFYDWTESYFLALAWRDKEAWRALDSGAKKAQWNDHQLEEIRAQMEARELQNNRPLLWEERVMMTYAVLFPQYARYREYARIVSWNSIKAQRRGDHALALQLIGAFAKITAKMRDNSRFYIERLVAIAMESIVISGATYDARKGGTPLSWKKGTPAQQTQTRFNSFGPYATAHGRQDLAKWVALDSPKAAAGRGGFIPTNVAGTSFRTACFISILWITGGLLLLMLPLCFIAYVVLSLVVSSARLQRWLPLNNFRDAISWRDLTAGTLACGGLNLLGYGLLGALSVALTIGGVAFGLGQIGVLSSEIASAWSSFLLALTSNTASGSPGVWESLFYTMLGSSGSVVGGQPDAYVLYANWMLALLPVMFGALWCAGVAVERQQQWQRRDAGDASQSAGGVLSFLKAAAKGRVFDTSGVARLEEKAEMHFDFLGWFFNFLRGVGIGVFWLSWILAAYWPGRSEALYFMLPISVAFALGVILWLDIFSRWRARRKTVTHRRRTVRFGLHLLRESWLGWLALGSLLFFLTLLLAVPMRARADAQLDRYLKLGEVAMMK